jgi:hypothetical protein
MAKNRRSDASQVSRIVGMHTLEDIPERKIHPDIGQPDFSLETGIFK